MSFGRFFKKFAGALFLLACVMAGAGYLGTMLGFSIPVVSWFIGHGGGEYTLMLSVITVAPFPVDPVQTGISLAYRNALFIADMILPRRRVGKQNFKMKTFPKETFLTIPKTLTGRTSKPNTVEIGYTEVDSSTKDYSLDAPIPNADIENASDGYDPVGAHTMALTDLIALDREQRVCEMAFDADNYGASNKITLTGSDQLSDTDSDAIDIIQTAIDSCFIKPNGVVMGRAVWKSVRKHPDIVSSAYQNSGNKGLISRQAFAEIFELDPSKVLVGESWYNSAKPGQTAVLVRLWGKSMLFFYDNPIATPEMGVTYGLTAEWKTRFAGPVVDPDVGARGGIRQRVAESLKEYIVAADCAYLISAAVA